MKKYFNKTTFYQGDGSIIIPLLIVYVAAFIVNILSVSNYFDWTIKTFLYGEGFNEGIFSFAHILFFGLYLVIVYIMTVGVFKRKKWSTLLSGPFSRMDIRKREFFIVSLSAIVYIVAFLFSILRGWCKEKEILSYMGNFHEIVLIDTLRLISVGIIIIGVLALLDSIIANIYFLFGSAIFLFIYLILLYSNFGQALSYYNDNYVYGLRYVINGVMEYAQIGYYGNPMSNFQIIIISIIIITIGSILVFIAKKLTNKMLLENMNEGIIFDFPKKIARFLIITFPGMIVSLFISEILESMYFRYNIGIYKLSLIRLVIVIVVSIACSFILKKITIKPKEIYRL